VSLVGDEEGGSGQGHGHGHVHATGGVLTDIDHVGIAVADLDAAVAWYRDMFGATVAHRERIESDGVEEALIKVADSYIQLLTPVTEDSPLAKFMARNGEGLHHVGYRVDDCEAVSSR
jgi:methylmalonyl-CoA epimerase